MNKSKIKYGVIPLLVIIGIVYAVKSGMLPFGHAKESVPPPTAVNITSQEVQYKKIAPKLMLTGSIEGETSAIISAKTGGRVAQVFVEDGQRVTAGQPLVRLENIELSNGASVAKEGVRKAQANYDNNVTEYNRYKILYEQKAVAKQQLDSIETKLKIAETELSSAYATLGNANKQLDDAVVVAPVSGVVANKSVVIGQVVSGGLSLMTVENIGQVYAVVNIEQKDMGVVKPGMAAEITVDSYQGQMFSGVIDIINPAAAASNRMYRTKIKLDNSDNRLKPGMFVKAGIVMGAEINALVVPQNAVFQKQGLYYVYVIQGDKVARQQIEIGQIIGDMIEVKTGVQEKALIATSNINTLKDGDTVAVERVSKNTQP
jgi:membrane fusion protein (multidrug efflux system)